MTGDKYRVHLESNRLVQIVEDDSANANSIPFLEPDYFASLVNKELTEGLEFEVKEIKDYGDGNFDSLQFIDYAIPIKQDEWEEVVKNVINHAITWLDKPAAINLIMHTLKTSYKITKR